LNMVEVVEDIYFRYCMESISYHMESMYLCDSPYSGGKV
jgi:hypothetical protein